MTLEELSAICTPDVKAYNDVLERMKKAEKDLTFTYNRIEDKVRVYVEEHRKFKDGDIVRLAYKKRGGRYIVKSVHWDYVNLGETNPSVTIAYRIYDKNGNEAFVPMNRMGLYGGWGIPEHLLELVKK